MAPMLNREDMFITYFGNKLEMGKHPTPVDVADRAFCGSGTGLKAVTWSTTPAKPSDWNAKFDNACQGV